MRHVLLGQAHRALPAEAGDKQVEAGPGADEHVGVGLGQFGPDALVGEGGVLAVVLLLRRHVPRRFPVCGILAVRHPGPGVEQGPNSHAGRLLEHHPVLTAEDRDDLHLVPLGQGFGQVEHGPVGAADAVDVLDQEADLHGRTGPAGFSSGLGIGK